jgi:hypothetical protein
VRRARLLLLAPLAALLLAGCGSSGEPRLTVGAVEDAAKWSDPAAQMQLAENAGYRAIVFSSVWKPPRTQPTARDLAALTGAVRAAAAAKIRPIVAVYQFSGDTPLTPAARAEFAAYAASIPRALPQVRDVIVGNEPNLPLFWQPQFAADGKDAAAPEYLKVLAESYDAIKKVSGNVNVIGGGLAARGGDRPGAARPTQSPTRFIEDLGAAYRASGRTRPVMDMFSLHPYPENSSIPPTFRHPRTTSISIADYPKLVRLLDRAFPGQEMPVVYGEYGLETTIPPPDRSSYTGTEPPAVDPISPARQGREYAEAIRLAACQPRVKMLLFFHVVDEAALTGLQTGVYYANDAVKASLPTVAAAANSAHDGRIQCGK